MDTPPIVTLTMNPAVDTSAGVDQVIAERKLRCSRPLHEPGGGGLNVARALRKMGADALALYPAGGPPGDLLRRLLDDEGLSHRQVPIEGWTRNNFIVMEKGSGQQYRFGLPGPELSAEEAQDCARTVSELDPAPDFLVASGSLPPGVETDFYAGLAQRAREAGFRLVLDASGTALRRAVEEGGGVYMLKPNVRELGDLLGRRAEEEGAQREALLELIDSGAAEVVVMSLGAGGVLYASAEGAEKVPAPTVPIQSKVGAGDSMVAGLVRALSLGRALPYAVRYGVAAGSAAVMTPGTELCRPDDVERLYNQMM